MWTIMAKVVVRDELCKSCGLCSSICPKQVLAIGKNANAKGYYAVTAAEDKCIGCGLCGLVCPDLALEIYK